MQDAIAPADSRRSQFPIVRVCPLLNLRAPYLPSTWRLWAPTILTLVPAQDPVLGHVSLTSGTVQTKAQSRHVSTPESHASVEGMVTPRCVAPDNRPEDHAHNLDVVGAQVGVDWSVLRVRPLGLEPD